MKSLRASTRLCTKKESEPKTLEEAVTDSSDGNMGGGGAPTPAVQ